MTTTSSRLTRETKSLINIGVLTPRLMKKYKQRKKKVFLIGSTYTEMELLNKPEIKSKVDNLLNFFVTMETLAKGSQYKFSRRTWILDTLTKELEELEKKMSEQNDA